MVQHVSYSSISPACFSMTAAPCEWDEPCARARAPSPWNPLPGSTKAPAVTKCPEPSRAGLCGCSSGTALSARPAGWMDDGTPAVVKARLPVAAVHGGRQIRLRERGQTTLLPCHCSFGAKERACVLLYWSVQTYERIAAIDRTTGGTDGGAAQCSCRRPGDCCHGTTTPYGCT